MVEKLLTGVWIAQGRLDSSVDSVVGFPLPCISIIEKPIKGFRKISFVKCPINFQNLTFEALKGCLL